MLWILDADSQVPLTVDAYANQSATSNSFRDARALLRQYLEVCCTEDVKFKLVSCVRFFTKSLTSES